MCVCACRNARGGGGGVVVCDVKHMSPRVLRQGGVSREDEGEEEERQDVKGDAYRHKLKKSHHE